MTVIDDASAISASSCKINSECLGFLLANAFFLSMILVAPTLSSNERNVFPAAICKAEDPARNSSLQWREDGMVNKDSNNIITVVCPFYWESSNDGSEFPNNATKLTMQAVNESDNLQSLACSLISNVSIENVDIGDKQFNLSLDPGSSEIMEWRVEAILNPKLTTFIVKCDLSKDIRLVFSESEARDEYSWNPGGSYETYLQGSSGRIAIRITLPFESRFSSGAPILIHTNTFFTPASGFDTWEELRDHGIIHISLLYPGDRDKSGSSSEGDKDYGGSESLAALRDVIKYASGEKVDMFGQSLAESSNIRPHLNNLGLYAFSHPGILATRVLGIYGSEIPSVNWFIGRENPTSSALSSVEIGHWGTASEAIQNSAYVYPDNYDPETLSIDYSSIRWAEGWSENGKNPGRPYFDFDGNRSISEGDYVLGSRIPSMYTKRIYSPELLRALESGFSIDEWPSELIAASEAEILWEERITTNIYDAIITSMPNLHVMLVFAKNDHVQPAPDKPHIHQAWDGFHKDGQGVWVRLNPDSVYVEHVGGVPWIDRSARTEPFDWLDIEDWGYLNSGRNSKLYSLAAVLEMVDRQYADIWSIDNLSEIVER